MSKKEIIILIIVFLLVIVISALSIYYIFNKSYDEGSKNSNILKVGEYTLRYGKYKGVEEEYNVDTAAIEKRDNIKFIKE